MRLFTYGLSCLLLVLATQAVAEDPKLLLADDFTTLDPAWGEAGDGKRVEGSQLLLTSNVKETVRVLHDGRKFDNADMRIQVKSLKGETGVWAGLCFWSVDADNYYLVLLRPDGQLKVVRKTSGRLVFPVLSHSCGRFGSGLNKVNQLRVVTSGPTVKVFVNGVEEASLRGFPPPGGGQIGVYVDTDKAIAVTAFSELRIFLSEPPAAAGANPDDNLLFSDDFSRLDPAWGEADASTKVSGNKLIMKAERGMSPGRLYEGALFGEADIRVNIRLAESEKSGVRKAAGIVFWVDNSDGLEFFMAMIAPDGSVFIRRRTKSGKFETPKSFSMRSEMRQGVGEGNELRLVAGRTSATLFVNGKQIGKIDGFKPPLAYKLGLKVESDKEEAYTWEFSDLSVRKLE